MWTRDPMQVIWIRPHLDMLCRVGYMLPPVPSCLHENSVCSHSNLTSYDYMVSYSSVRGRMDGIFDRVAASVVGTGQPLSGQIRPDLRQDTICTNSRLYEVANGIQCGESRAA